MDGNLTHLSAEDEIPFDADKVADVEQYLLKTTL
jgi:hypothetical protein